MKTKLVVCLLALGCATGLVNAQDMNWGSDKPKAVENYTLLSDLAKANDFKGALPPLQWLLKNTPNLSKDLYINGAKVYEGMVTQTTDPKAQTAYEDSALLMYDLRMKYFQDEANVMNRKGTKAYAYLSDRPDAKDQMYELYKKIVELNGDQTYNANVQVYMATICEQKGKGKLTDEQVLTEYDKISTIIDKGLTNNDAAQKQAWTTTKDYVDKMLQSCVTIDCNFVKTKLGPKFQQNPEDAEMAKKIFGLMATGKCTDDPLFLQAGEALVKKEPNYGVYRVLATVSESQKDYDKAIQYFEEAAKLSTVTSEKAESYNEIAQIHQRKGSKSSARTYYLKAVENGKKDAYSSIADMYLTSGDDCKNSDAIKSKLVYIAAYEMYQKAGNQAGMTKAKQYFPTNEEVFTVGMTDKIGTQMNTGCWVNETVTLQTTKRK